jgi:hypothetical protein
MAGLVPATHDLCGAGIAKAAAPLREAKPVSMGHRDKPGDDDQKRDN